MLVARRVVSFIAVALCLFLVTACSLLPTSMPEPTATPMPTATPTLSPTPLPTPTPSPAPTLTAEQAEYARLKISMDLAPDIPGTTKAIQNINGLNRVVYLAVEENTYGIKANEYVGEYKYEVTLDGKQVGGIALIPSIVLKMLNEQLAAIHDEQEKNLIALPTDISDSNSIHNVDISIDRVATLNNYISISIDCGEESISVASVLIKSQKVNCLYSLNMDGYVGILSQSYESGIDMTPENVTDFTRVMFKTDLNEISKLDGQVLAFGNYLGNTSDVVYLSNVSRTQVFEPDGNDLLKYDNVPIFIISNKS